MWLHRENEYEWKYIGVWLDLLPEEFCTKVKGLISDCEVESIFLPFEQYPTVVDMVQNSLKVRNSIPAVIDVNDKKQNEKRCARIEEIEIAVKNFREALMFDEMVYLYVYINSKNEFRVIKLREGI